MLNKYLYLLLFRKNPRHRVEMAHPGDVDYILPVMPEPNEDAPDCSYGRKCYRLNPDHFKNFKHPRNSKNIFKISTIVKLIYIPHSKYTTKLPKVLPEPSWN